ncbi:MAG: SIS domain-containing protein [Clostridia bacterium]|nr:SIS domain-containing protein [Clostridia bacterium]
MGPEEVLREYARRVEELLEEAVRREAAAVEQAARLVAEAVAGGGVIFTFGTGHSHLVAEEVAYRAGVLVPVDAILEPSLTGHQDVAKSERLERLEGFGEAIVEHRRLGPGDVLIVISNSGRNAAPVEVAMAARRRGVPVIAVTSLPYSRAVASRHSSGRKLYELADVVLDTGTPLGDALLRLPGLGQPVAPASGLMGIFLVQAVLAGAAALLLERGIQPPVWESGNLDGASERNARWFDRYRGRIRIW